MFAPFAGVLAGFAHVVTGPDHLAALAPIALNDRRRAVRLGATWGLGHGTGVLILGTVGIVARRFIDLEAISAWSEVAVGLLLIVIGLWALRRGLRVEVHTHEHEHDDRGRHVHAHVHHAGLEHTAKSHTAHTHAAFGIGVLHGTAGGGHILGVLPSLALPTGAAIAYLLAYFVAAVLAMSAVGFTLGQLGRSGGPRMLKGLMVGSATAAMVVGVIWLGTAWPG